MGQCTSGGAGSRGIEDARAQGKSLNGALKSDVDRVKSEMSEKSGNQTAADDDADYIYDAGITRTRSFIAEHVETHYTIEEELGQGQFATVFKGKHKKTGRVVAIKMIDRKDTGADVTQSATDKEIQIMKAVNHPNCVQLIEIYQTDDEVQLVMELLEGQDLFDRILARNPKKFPEGKARELMQKLCAGVRHLHEHRIIHRDLKPENILLVSTDLDCTDVKVADFGLSKLFPDEATVAATQTRCGTPGYVAPEVLNRKKYGYKIDSWACGVIAYIVLCGFPPFPLNMEQRSLQKVNAADFRFPSRHWSGISAEAKDFIRRMLVVKADDRMGLDEAMEHPWLQ